MVNRQGSCFAKPRWILFSSPTLRYHFRRDLNRPSEFQRGRGLRATLHGPMRASIFVCCILHGNRGLTRTMYDFVRYSEVRKKARITLQKFWSGENREGLCVLFHCKAMLYFWEYFSRQRQVQRWSLLNQWTLWQTDTPLPSPLHTLPSLLPYV